MEIVSQPGPSLLQEFFFRWKPFLHFCTALVFNIIHRHKLTFSSLNITLRPKKCKYVGKASKPPGKCKFVLVLVLGVFGALHSIQSYNCNIQSIKTQLFKSKCPSPQIALNIGGDGHSGLVWGESLGGGSKGGGAKFFLLISFQIH